MSELYYAEMEAARNEAEDGYFKARPQLLGTATERSLFRAGFERAFQKLWFTHNPILALPSVGIPQSIPIGTGTITTDCGCPTNHVCMNVACPRNMRITC